MEVVIMGKVHGMKDVEKMFASCPGILRNELLNWLLFENRLFIGDKKISGAVRNRLERTKTWISGQGWKTQVSGLFKGYVVDPLTNQRVSYRAINKSNLVAGTGLFGSGISMVLKMGLLYTNQKPIHKAVESLTEPHNVTSEKYMPIPVKGLNISKPYAKFKWWLKSGKFRVAYKNGMAFYFWKDKPKKDRSALMFVGKKST
jgi:hypothetical protein